MTIFSLFLPSFAAQQQRRTKQDADLTLQVDKLFKAMANKFEAEVDVEMGSNGNVKNSQVVTSPQDIMVKPYFATVDQVTAYYNVRSRAGGEGEMEGA